MTEKERKWDSHRLQQTRDRTLIAALFYIGSWNKNIKRLWGINGETE